jgi:3-methyladenine DNA glycosylase AlkD
MTLQQALAALKKAGTAQNVKVYGRHGVKGEMYGVSFADLNKLKKTIGTDHDLACALWETGNHDARVLATMIADPAALTGSVMDAWARELDNYVLCDAFSAMIARTGAGLRKYGAWKRRKGEFVAAAAYNVLAAVACYRDGAEIDEAFAREEIDAIAATIHDRPNRTRHSMNQALIALGAVNAGLAQHAKAAARRMGKIEVDHGQTSCKTPDAAAYIDQTRAHREKMAARAKAKKKARG